MDRLSTYNKVKYYFKDVYQEIDYWYKMLSMLRTKMKQDQDFENELCVRLSKLKREARKNADHM